MLRKPRNPMGTENQKILVENSEITGFCLPFLQPTYFLSHIFPASHIPNFYSSFVGLLFKQSLVIFFPPEHPPPPQPWWCPNRIFYSLRLENDIPLTRTLVPHGGPKHGVGWDIYIWNRFWVCKSQHFNYAEVFILIVCVANVKLTTWYNLCHFTKIFIPCMSHMLVCIGWEFGPVMPFLSLTL